MRLQKGKYQNMKTLKVLNTGHPAMLKEHPGQGCMISIDRQGLHMHAFA